MFQKKPEHFCSPHVYITNEIFFGKDLLYVKKYREWKKPVCNSHSSHSIGSGALPTTHICFMQTW